MGLIGVDPAAKEWFGFRNCIQGDPLVWPPSYRISDADEYWPLMGLLQTDVRWLVLTAFV